MQFEGKVAVVTGSTRGIGRAIAEQFAQAGAKVVITGTTEKCHQVGEEMKAKGYQIHSVVTNVTDKQSIANLFQEAVKVFGKVDILVNNAGIARDATLVKMTEEQWDEVMNTNLKSLFFTCKEALKLMIPQGYGKIVNIASRSGQAGNFGQTNYSTSKAGVIMFTKTLMKEVAKKGIYVNCVAPGFIETDMTSGVPDIARKTLVDAIPMGRAGKPQEVANAVLFLASDYASFINGQTLGVNGGNY